MTATHPAPRYDRTRPELAALGTQWARLVARLDEFAPSVVVLVARKAPRLQQTFGMTLSGAPLLISDLAIPFSARQLAGARVAVVDDVVNVGSTIRRAEKLAWAAGAAEVQTFAIAQLAARPDAPNGIALSAEDILDEDGLRAFARCIPEALQALPKPYDLDFPLLPCELVMPYSTFEDLLYALAEGHGDDRVYDLTSPFGRDIGVRRLAVDPITSVASHLKLRIYLEEATGRCNVVPIAVAGTLDDAAPDKGSRWREELWQPLHDEIDYGADPATDTEEVRAARRDAASRLRLFVDSLDFGVGFLDAHSGLLRLVNSVPFSVEDAELTLGPRVRRATHALVNTDSLGTPDGREEVRRTPRETTPPSPFFSAAEEHGLLAAIRDATPGRDVLSLFIAVFEALAEVVGANDPNKYEFGWPYSRDEVQRDPYLRLRIGPTVPDLVSIIQKACGADLEVETVRREVTRLLDRYIDSGGVVPTTAEYAGQIYRIYRKGERNPRVGPADRVINAWRSYGEPLSLTRVSKLAAFLAYADPTGSEIRVRPVVRGNTAAFASSVLHDETEISHYLRNTGRIKPAHS